MTAKFLSVAVALAIGWSAGPARAQGAETEFRATLDALERDRAEPVARGSLQDTKSIQAALRPDEIVVVFFLAEPQSFRWVISREHLVFDRIAGRAAIEKDVARLRELLRSPSAGAELEAASRQLGGMLFEAISTADDHPMVIVPHGVLHDVPFEVLTLQNRMVVERHAVSYAPSLNTLVQLRRSPANPAPFRVLWNSNDRFAAEFMQRFYREVNQGQSSEEALRRAKLAYVNHPRYSHPFYWSPLVMFGDGSRALVEKPVDEPVGLTILAAALTLSALAIVFQHATGQRRQKRKESVKCSEVSQGFPQPRSNARFHDFRPELSTNVTGGHIF